MKVISTAPAFEQRIGATVERSAAPRLLEQARGAVRVRTGAYRASLVANTSHDVLHRTIVTIGSPLRYGRPLEYGANVGKRRGPHMTGDHRLEEVTRASWGSLVAGALRNGY